MYKRMPQKTKKTFTLSLKAVVAFLSTAVLCLSLISITVVNRMQVERLTMEQLITEKSAKAGDIINRLLYKTQALVSLAIQGDGTVEDFERVAATIMDDPSILNLLLAPNGVVSDVYPLAGNEAVIGLDFFGEGAGNKEAMLAVESGQLVLGGPFDLVQGGQALVGRLPVYINAPDGSREFWGLVSVTLKYPQVLDAAGLNELRIDGFLYEIWRVNPDNNEKQIIAGNDAQYNHKLKYIEKKVNILNAEWYFRILPMRLWYQYNETWILAFLSICMSALVAFVVQNNHMLRGLKSELEDLAYTDSLTKVYNRRHFMELAERRMEQDEQSFIVVLDVDNFKQINDTHGHLVGDQVINHIALRAKNTLRTDDLLARFGGDEFVVLASCLTKEGAQTLAERLRLSISQHPVTVEDERIPVTISLGIAWARPINDIDTALRQADEALYLAKAQNRNKVVFYDEEPGE